MNAMKIQGIADAAREVLQYINVSTLEDLQGSIEHMAKNGDLFKLAYSQMQNYSEHWDGPVLDIIPRTHEDDDQVGIEITISRTAMGYDAMAMISHEDGYNGHMVADKYLINRSEVARFIHKLTLTNFRTFDPNTKVDLGARGIKIYADNF